METKSMAVREQNWLQTLQQAAASGLSNQEWCEQNGVALSTFYKWKHALRNQLLAQLESTPGTDMRFAQVTLPAAEQPFTEPLSVCCNGLALNISPDLSEEKLVRILRAVRHAW